MIDVTTFRQETPGNHPFLEKKLVSSFSEEFLSNPAPPEDVLILMPPAFFGYSMEDKTWRKFGCKTHGTELKTNQSLI